MDELNITPQPEGDNPQGDASNPPENQPTNPPADQDAFSINKESESAPTPVQPEGGVLETGGTEPVPQPEPMPEQNNPAQMESQPEPSEPSEDGNEDHPTVLEQAEEANGSEKKGGLPKWALIALGVLGLVAVVGAVVYFTNPTLFQGQLRDSDQELQFAASEYCQDGYYWPGSQSNDIGMSLNTGHAQSLLNLDSVRSTDLTVTDKSPSTTI